MAMRGSGTRDSYGVLQGKTCIALGVRLHDGRNARKIAVAARKLEALDSQLSYKASAEEDF